MSEARVPIAIARTHLWWLIAAGVLLAVAAVAASLRIRLLPISNTIEASGTIEVTQSDVSPKVGGRLVALRVKDGDPVKRGQVIAVLERLVPALSLDQARAGVAAALAQVAAAQAAYNLQKTTYTTTLSQANEGVSIAQSYLGQAGENLGIETNATSLAVDQALAQLAAAQSTYHHAEVNLVRARSLASTGDVPQQALDDAANQYASAGAQLQAAHDALALAQANRRNVQIRRLGVLASRSQQRQSVSALDSAKAEQEVTAQRHAQMLVAQGQLAQARAALGLAEDQVRETRITAPFDGYVISHNVEVGDLIGPGSAVMTIGDLTHPYVYVYVSETDVPRIKTGMRADVAVDGLPGRTFTGNVTQTGTTAEFTPENVQTKEQRIEYLVFRIRIQFTDTTGTLKPGLPVDATIHV
ncbi:MAG: HlyD family secretion protein [Vulcanimicrobiaceae bacterium]